MMKRITRESENSDMIWFVDRECEEGDKIILREPCEMDYRHSKIAIKNLAEYEKTKLEPQQIEEISNLYAEKCKEVAELKAEIEKSVKLPCKVGDTVYWISHFKSGIIQGEVSGILISGFGFDLKITDATGMTITKEFEKIFLTREEAEKALAEMEKKK